MKNKFTILGCGSSLGSPWITNYTGKLKNNSKNIRTRCCAHIQYGGLSILIDTSPDIKNQFLKNTSYEKFSDSTTQNFFNLFGKLN